jgi:hypothetical protein
MKPSTLPAFGGKTIDYIYDWAKRMVRLKIVKSEKSGEELSRSPSVGPTTDSTGSTQTITGNENAITMK